MADLDKSPPFAPTAAYPEAVHASVSEVPDVFDMPVMPEMTDISGMSGPPAQRRVSLTSFDLLDAGDGEQLLSPLLDIARECSCAITRSCRILSGRRIFCQGS